MSKTPETDAVADIDGNWDTKALRMTAHARKLEQRLAEAIAATPWAANSETKEEWLDRQREKYVVLERQLAEAREQRDRLAEALEAITRRTVIAGSTGWYRNGQIDALRACSVVAKEALATVQQCGYCDGTGGQDSGGITPWGSEIIVKCGHCGGTGKEALAAVKGDKS